MMNNAGIGPNYSHDPALRLHETPEYSWDRIMGVNGKGVWLGCSEYLQPVPIHAPMGPHILIRINHPA